MLDKISGSCYDGSTLKNGGPCHADRNEEMHPFPGGLTSVSSDKDYDSRSVNLMFAWGRFEDECCSLTFSGSQVVVAGPNNRGFQVYHSVDPELLDRLTAEVQTYGVKN